MIRTDKKTTRNRTLAYMAVVTGLIVASQATAQTIITSGNTIHYGRNIVHQSQPYIITGSVSQTVHTSREASYCDYRGCTYSRTQQHVHTQYPGTAANVVVYDHSPVMMHGHSGLTRTRTIQPGTVNSCNNRYYDRGRVVQLHSEPRISTRQRVVYRSGRVCSTPSRFDRHDRYDRHRGAGISVRFSNNDHRRHYTPGHTEKKLRIRLKFDD